MRFRNLPARASSWLVVVVLVLAGLASATPSSAGSLLTQGSPTTGTVIAGLSSSFTTTLNMTGQTGTLDYATSAATGLTVNSATGVVTTTGALTVGPYSASGTFSDSNGDTGSWAYALTVTGVAIVQAAPVAGLVSTTSSGTFTAQLESTGGTGSVTYVTTSTNPALTVSPLGAIVTAGSLPAQNYTVSGTDSDSLGDTGTWTYTLTVINPSGGGGGSSSGGSLRQTSPTSGATTPAASSSFTIGSLAVSNATGLVTFITTASSTGLSVTNAGAITTTGTLTVGSYTVAGTDTDTSGDTGNWTYTLTVNNPSTTVTFASNLGKGSMAAETKNAPTALTPNLFTRTGYVFANWNTAADGSGTSYANGGTFPFAASTTLYAQWTASKIVAVSHTVVFNANGGIGSMPSETKNVLAVLTYNRFVRTGYTFSRWSTSADGSGSSYADGGAYPFNTSVTLYAQWVAAQTFTVSFNANGGTGSMSPETKSVAATLKPIGFRRSGHDFVKWNTSANGSGSSYVNGGTYPFTASTTLYAQWKTVRVVTLPAVDAAVTLSPFGANSSLLTPALKSQIAQLARDIKVNRDTKIALVGYSGKLAAVKKLNEEAWAANLKISGERATQVEAYLRQQLASIGVRSVTITAAGTGDSNPPGSLASVVSQAKNRCVIATIT